MVTVRVFLLDDHEVVRRGLRELLEAGDDLEVVGEAAAAEEGYGRFPARARAGSAGTTTAPTGGQPGSSSLPDHRPGPVGSDDGS